LTAFHKFAIASIAVCTVSNLIFSQIFAVLFSILKASNAQLSASFISSLQDNAFLTACAVLETVN
jgi:p-aminobenzoyl-glutamate transporter AbgT